MSYVRENSAKVWASIGGLILVLGMWAITLIVFACIGGFFVFSAFVRHDRSDELHITL